MEKIKIIADSTCDLPEELLNRYDITIIPLNIIMDENEYQDGFEILPDEIYKWSDKTGRTPKTSAPVLERIQNTLKVYDQEGMNLIFFGISEAMSTTCNAVRLIGEELENARLFVIDSMSLSTGIGLQVIRAAEMADSGMKAEAIVEKIKKERAKVQASFVVDTLTFLYRGGRCGGVTALLGNRLRLHPKILVKDGKMGVDKKYRGKMDKVLLNYAHDLESDMKKALPEHVFITHSGVDEEIVQQIKEFIEQTGKFKQIHITRAGGVISSHCGPGTLGVLFYFED